MFFNSHIVNFVWETDKGEAGNIILLIFVLWGGFNCRWVWVKAESLIWSQLKSHLSVSAFFRKLVGLNPEARAKYLTILPPLATAWFLITRASPIYLVDEFIRLLPVSLKEMRTLRESKVLFFFYFWC